MISQLRRLGPRPERAAGADAAAPSAQAEVERHLQVRILLLVDLALFHRLSPRSARLPACLLPLSAV